MNKIKQAITVANKKGLHARPAAMLVQLTSSFESHITINFEGQEVNGKSIMGILTLGAHCGAVLHVVVEGPDAQQAIDALTLLLNKQEEELIV